MLDLFFTLLFVIRGPSFRFACVNRWRSRMVSRAESKWNQANKELVKWLLSTKRKEFLRFRSVKKKNETSLYVLFFLCFGFAIYTLDQRTKPLGETLTSVRTSLSAKEPSKTIPYQLFSTIQMVTFLIYFLVQKN